MPCSFGVAEPDQRQPAFRTGGLRRLRYDTLCMVTLLLYVLALRNYCRVLFYVNCYVGIIVRDSGSITTMTRYVWRLIAVCIRLVYGIGGLLHVRPVQQQAFSGGREMDLRWHRYYSKSTTVYGMNEQFVLRRLQPASNHVLQGDAPLCEHMHVAGTVGAEVEGGVAAAGDLWIRMLRRLYT